MSVLWEEDHRFGRGTLEEEPDGRLLLTVSGPGPAAGGVAFVLNGEEGALFRAWGARYAESLARQVRRFPEEYADRNLLPPFEPGGGGDAEGEEPLAAASRRFGAAAALFAALLLAFLVAWALDRPVVPGAERLATALSLHAAPVEEQEQAFLVVAFPEGGEATVPVPREHALRPGAEVAVREYRSRLFGKRAYRFVRYP